VTIEQVHIHKEVDVEKVIDRIDKRLGGKIELMNRGQIPTETHRQ
jgi:hypothetical protein